MAASAVGERRRNAAHRERRGAERGDREAQAVERLGVLVGRGHFERRRRERRRHQQRLHRHALVQRRLQPLVDDALVRRVHVDEHEARAVLREHVDAVQLREREAERMRVAGVGQVRHDRRRSASRAPKSFA